MSTIRRLVAVLVATALTVAGGAVLSTTTAHADPPGSVIQETVVYTTVQPFESGTFRGDCPISHPWLINRQFAHGRLVPDGVHVNATGGIVVTAGVPLDARTTRTTKGGHEFDSWKAVSGVYTNVDFVPNFINITLECTHDWDLAKHAIKKQT